MKMTAKIIALISLIFVILPSILFLTGSMQLDTAKHAMFITMVIWFIFATIWMWNDNSQAS